MCQHVVQLILHFVDPITCTVCRHTKKIHAGMRLRRSNLTRQVWSMIDARGTSREARRALQVMEVTNEIPHDMRYRKGAAKF